MHKVSIVKCESYKNEEVRAAILTSLKNLDFSFKKNMKVLLKPNLLSPNKPEQGVTTHPAVLEELCKILKQYNVDIYIGESSGIDTKKSFEVCGINKLAKYAKIINFETQEKRFFDLGYKDKVPLPKIIFDMDLVVNIAKLKTHNLTQLTLCTKNLYGCIPGRLKSIYHRIFPRARDFSLLLSRIEKTISPGLNIIDGIVGLEGNGPGAGGIPIKSKILIASKSAGAADIIASEIAGFSHEEIYTNQFCGIKIKDIEKVGNAKNISMKFKKSTTYNISFLSPLYKFLPRPKIAFDKDKCKKCHLCEDKCPVKAIKLVPWPKCNSKKCIKCLCCMELCPSNAVYLKEGKIVILLKKIRDKISK